VELLESDSEELKWMGDEEVEAGSRIVGSTCGGTLLEHVVGATVNSF
jgi:hypothetical protein